MQMPLIAFPMRAQHAPGLQVFLMVVFKDPLSSHLSFSFMIPVTTIITISWTDLNKCI